MPRIYREDDRGLVGDMLEAIAKAQTISAGDRSAEAVIFACAYLVAVMGEAASKITPELRNQYAEIPWREIINMRHRIIHGYGNLDHAILWSVVDHHLPELKERLSSIHQLIG